MLPRLLCEELCSLNSGEDRLAFSVVWTMTSAGEVMHLLLLLTVSEMQLSVSRFFVTAGLKIRRQYR